MCASISRRKFIGKASAGLGAGTIGLPFAMHHMNDEDTDIRKPLEVWVGTVSCEGLSVENAEEMITKILNVLQVMVPMQPDIICLPETFAFRTLEEFHKTGGAASFSGSLFEPLRKFSRQHKCYMICPTYTEMKGNFYNAAILMDRNGEKAGEYLKIHPAASEIDDGIRPGPLDPPVFETDFGKIGIQICYDVKWDDGWSRLKQLGSEIIFWPSAYPGGEELKSKAWLKQVHVISSTRKGISRICDMTGEVIAQTGFWQPNYACAPIHPEKAVIPTWPYVSEFPAMLKKYNKRIHVKTFDEEEWTLLESLDGNLKMADIMAEFGFKTQYQALTDIEEIQKRKR